MIHPATDQSPPWKYRNLLFMLVLFVCAMGSRGYYLYHTGIGESSWFDQGYPKSDAQMYDKLGQNILQGKEYVWIENGHALRSYAPPLYPVFLSYIYYYFGTSYPPVILIQIVLSSLTIVLFYRVGALIFNSWAGFWAAMLTAFYFPYIYFTASILTECLFIFFAALTMYYGTLAGTVQTDKKTILLTGLFLGLAVMTRPAGIALLPGLLVWFLIQWRFDLKKTIKNSLLIIVTLLAVMSPWLIRSQIIHGQIVPFTIMGAKQMAVAYNPEYKSDFYIRRVWWNMLWYNPNDSEIKKYNQWNHEAKQHIQENPVIAAWYTKIRFFRFWEMDWPKSWFTSDSFSFLDGLKLLSLLLFPISIFGICVSLRNWRKNLLLYLTLFNYTLFHAIAGARERYRLPVDWVLFLFAGYGIYFLGKMLLSLIQRKQHVENS